MLAHNLLPEEIVKKKNEPDKRKGEPGFQYREAVTTLINQTLRRNEVGQLVVDENCPELKEVRRHSSTANSYEGHEIVIWEVAKHRCGSEADLLAAIRRGDAIKVTSGDFPKIAFPKHEMGQLRSWGKENVYEKKTAVANSDWDEFDVAMDDFFDQPLEVLMDFSAAGGGHAIAAAGGGQAAADLADKKELIFCVCFHV